MDAYRDQYAQIFGDTSSVRLLAISVDPDTMQAAWAKEKGYTPWTFLSDSGAVVGTAYGATRAIPNGLIDNRTLFVVDKKGQIVHVMAPFRESDPTAYTDLAEAIKKAKAMP
ncbi:MAG TPA: redoxin domain-containing protein [Gemmatimonadales bacterium]|nr:redoxin domain-containing protein [Gemmatimonadales bacterium]